MAIDKGNSDAMVQFGEYYHTEKYEEMKSIILWLSKEVIVMR